MYMFSNFAFSNARIVTTTQPSIPYKFADAVYLTKSSQTYTVTTSDDTYVSSEIVNLVYSLPLSVVAPEAVTTFPIGDSQIVGSLTVSCTATPLQLTIAPIADVNFGQVTIGTGESNVSRDFTIQITSGTQIPSGSFSFSSTNTNSNDRINLGGGEVILRDKATNDEYHMNRSYPITSRNTTYVAELNIVGAAAGEATENLTVTMTVN